MVPQLYSAGIIKFREQAILDTDLCKEWTIKSYGDNSIVFCCGNLVHPQYTTATPIEVGDTLMFPYEKPMVIVPWSLRIRIDKNLRDMKYEEPRYAATKQELTQIKYCINLLFGKPGGDIRFTIGQAQNLLWRLIPLFGAFDELVSDLDELITKTMDSLLLPEHRKLSRLETMRREIAPEYYRSLHQQNARTSELFAQWVAT